MDQMTCLYQDAVVKIIELIILTMLLTRMEFLNFKSIPFGNYNIEISFVGYKTTITSIQMDQELNKGLIVHLVHTSF
jgi:hypothetical protein